LKKEAKTCARLSRTSRRQPCKSFLVLFFKKELLPSLVLGFFLATPALAAPPVTVSAAWARATLPHQDEGAAYLTLQSKVGDTLSDISSPEAGMVMLHETAQKAGMSNMVDVDHLDLPPGQSVALAPGGTHLMLMDLKHPLKAGDTLHLALHFEKAGTQNVAVKVLDVHATGPAP
jgi:copper(I)-binding protein